MRVLLLVLAAAVSSGAVADSCVTLEGSTLVNKCQTCMKATARALRPEAEQSAGMFASEPRTVRIEPGSRSALPAGQRYAITELEKCN